MALRRRRAARLLSAVALLAASPARPNVTGNVELQSHTTQNLSPGADRSGSTLLMETLSLHYAGMPFGPSVAVATLGGGFSNASSWPASGLRADAQVLSFDASLGFLPRRSVPLRLYGSGSLNTGTPGALAVHGAGPTLLYGGSLNLDPGALPGLRLDVSEGRASREGNPDLSDVQRRLAASSHGLVGGQRVTLAVRVEDDHRERSADVTSLAATLSVSAAPHQTILVANEVRRSIPNLAGITADRTLSATSDQRWSRAFTTQLGARYSEASAAGATGSVGDARAAVTWAPLAGAHQLTLSGGGEVGTQRTAAPGAEGRGESYGGNARLGYARPLSGLTGGLAVGASADVCDCSFGNEGLATLFDATVSLGLPAHPRGSAQSSFTLALARAPLGRGGDRVEQHARASGRLLVAATTLTATLSYDDGVRDLVDITAARAANVHERTVGGSLGATRELGPTSLHADVRHARGRVVTDGSAFFARDVRQARTVTSGQGGLSWRPRHDVGIQAQAIGTWTTLDDETSIGSYGASGSLGWRVGLVTASLQYQAARVELVGVESSFQHALRVVISRPFEL